MQAWEKEIVGIIESIVVVAIKIIYNYCSCISVAHYLKHTVIACIEVRLE